MAGVVSPLDLTQYIDFQSPDCPFETPFETDSRILSLDFYQTSQASDTRYVMVGTTRSVYLLTETRNTDRKHFTAITCANISDGTFWTDEAKAAFKDQ